MRDSLKWSRILPALPQRGIPILATFVAGTRLGKLGAMPEIVPGHRLGSRWMPVKDTWVNGHACLQHRSRISFRLDATSPIAIGRSGADDIDARHDLRQRGRHCSGSCRHACEDTIAKMRTIQQAALAPAEPSSQDRRVAAQATHAFCKPRASFFCSRTRRRHTPPSTMTTATSSASLARPMLIRKSKGRQGAFDRAVLLRSAIQVLHQMHSMVRLWRMPPLTSH
jgi:hypothetical protein